MGDGINDAPSLHAVDVGISVASAVDVAREAEDSILLKPGLQILHKGIEGRRASANVMKYLLMGPSSNFGNMFSMAGASVFILFVPMLPTQILLNNFLYDTAQITIPSENVDEQYIRAPRRWNMTLIRNFMIFIGPISSIYDFLTFNVLLHYFPSNANAGPFRDPHNGQSIEEPAQCAPRIDDDLDRGHWLLAALLSAQRPARIHGSALGFLGVLSDFLSNVLALGRTCQAPAVCQSGDLAGSSERPKA